MLRVIDEIQHVGLYSLILQDIQKITGKEKPSAKEVEEALQKHPSLLRDYMQTTVEYNLSNIHLKDINLDHIAADCHVKAKKINENLAILRKLEKYTLDFEQSSTLVLIFSVEFLVLFSVQYFIVLLNLKMWQWYIYGLFALSIVVAWIYAKKVRKKYENGNTEYERLYKETLKLIELLEEKGELCKADLYIGKSDEHI
ncbi:MAG: hypothetical protein LGB01_04115 [Sulfurovum sp.]|nr:hypothetical protein [Sulfurovum sp.]